MSLIPSVLCSENICEREKFEIQIAFENFQIKDLKDVLKK